MNLQILKPRRALNKAFLKVKPNRIEIERFKYQLTYLLDRSNDSETEEFHKNLVMEFLKKTYYDPTHYINTKGKNDLVIHTRDKASSPVGVIIEAKKPTNKTEMLALNNINVKAFQELVLYYLRERILHKNLEIKHLIATNSYEWFIFDATVFDRLFAQNHLLVAQFLDFENGRLSGNKTDFFYKELAAPFIKSLTQEIPFTHFDLSKYEKPLRNKDPKDDNQLIALFKLLSPEHLLKLPFTNDSNSLDRRFYGELLHIMGLRETKSGGKKLIERNPENSRNNGSLLENTILQLDSLDKISRMEKPGNYGDTSEERLFNVGLELCITWINRILFLKLLEAQLISYHQGNKAYAFLGIDKIKNYDGLNKLFFQVLARKHAERTPGVQQHFENVPYLNSSLFEPSEMEHRALLISNLEDEVVLPLYSATILKDQKGKKRTGAISTLQYIFEFLNAYDFSNEGSEEIQEENKTLINASVLGLIFEKINGYKDGSFFTPGFITMYMCRESIRNAVIQKFNEAKNWDCKDLEELYNVISDRNEANQLINSLKICDPAVGSGHFLVSALNEIIALKSDLNLLQDRNGRRLKEYHVEVVNDELIITDENGELVEYRPGNPESQRIQEALFHEKQTLIENCLFGVDINPNSVKICRLRLWIELLKNAYYINTKANSAQQALETLPNIDINIKWGNSLISRFAIDADLHKALKKSRFTIDSYRTAVHTYRNAQNKEEKREMERLITSIKGDFRMEITNNDPKVKRKARLGGELYNLTMQQGIFEESPKEKKVRLAKVAKVESELNSLEAEIKEIRENRIFENAFEWRFEFPEVLDPDGAFRGFDMIIGNPPYIRQEAFSNSKSYLQENYQIYSGTADMYTYFVELGLRLLKRKGDFMFIIPNKWMRASYGSGLRQLLKRNTLLQLIDFGDLPVFEEATTYPCILQLKKGPAVSNFQGTNVDTLDFQKSLAGYIQENALQVLTDELPDGGWTLVDSSIQQLMRKIRNTGIPLGEYVGNKIYRGVLTGLNEAFIITAETRERLIREDPGSNAVIKPFLSGRDIKRYRKAGINKYLIFFPKGFTIKRNLPPDDPNYLDDIQEPPPRYGDMPYPSAWEWIVTHYPAIANYLQPYKQKAEARYDKGDFWWELRACDYYDAFEKPKIMLPDIAVRAEAMYDESNAYCVNTAYIIPSNDLELLGILNSRLIHFFYKHLTTSIRGGYLRFIRQYLAQIPIPTGKEKLQTIRATVKAILTEKNTDPNADTAEWEKQIDQLVYELYELKAEEIQLIETQLLAV